MGTKKQSSKKLEVHQQLKYYKNNKSCGQWNGNRLQQGFFVIHLHKDKIEYSNTRYKTDQKYGNKKRDHPDHYKRSFSALGAILFKSFLAKHIHIKLFTKFRLKVSNHSKYLEDYSYCHKKKRKEPGIWSIPQIY